MTTTGINSKPITTDVVHSTKDPVEINIDALTAMNAIRPALEANVYNQQNVAHNLKMDSELDAENENYFREIAAEIYGANKRRPMNITWENSDKTLTSCIGYDGANVSKIERFPTEKLKETLEKNWWRTHLTFAQIKEIPLNRWEITRLLAEQESDAAKWIYPELPESRRPKYISQQEASTQTKGLKPKQFVICNKFTSYVVLLIRKPNRGGAPIFERFNARRDSQEFHKKVATLKAEAYVDVTPHELLDKSN